MRKAIVLLGIVFILFIPLSVSAAEKEDLTQKIDKYIEESLDLYNIPGASLKIIKSGESFYQGNWGEMSDESDVTSDTPFLIGSLSKPVTSLAIIMLHEDGKIELDEPIRTYIPTFTYETDSSKEITVMNLLEQTSGISQLNGLKVTDIDTVEEGAITKAVAKLSGVKLTNEPGTVYEYNSANYLLLGSIIEQVTNLSYSEFVDESIFAPLGMSQTAADYESAIEKGFVPGFESWLGKPVVSDGLYDQSGAPYGYIVSTANDLAAFLTFMLEGGDVLSEKNLGLLQTPPEEQGAYGLGWRYSKTEGFPFHGGATPDYRAEMFFIPEQDYGAVLLTNKYNSMEDFQVHYIMEGIRSIMNGTEPAPLPEPSYLLQWIVLGVTGLIVILTVVHIIILKRKKSLVRKWSYTYGAFLILLAVGIIPTVVYVMNSPWKTARLFAPDLAFFIQCLVGIVAINGIIPFIFLMLDKKRVLNSPFL